MNPTYKKEFSKYNKSSISVLGIVHNHIGKNKVQIPKIEM